MKNEAEKILLETFRRENALEAADPREWDGWERSRHAYQREHGPAYACGQWFPLALEHEQKRFRRAIDELEKSGRLETHREWGRRLSHVKLTPAGRAEAARIAAELDHGG